MFTILLYQDVAVLNPPKNENHISLKRRSLSMHELCTEIKNICRCTAITVTLKQHCWESITTKKLPASIMKGAKRIVNFALQQLKHPAVRNFIRDQAGILAMAAPAMAARAAEEGVAIAGRTTRRFGGIKKD